MAFIQWVEGVGTFLARFRSSDWLKYVWKRWFGEGAVSPPSPDGGGTGAIFAAGWTESFWVAWTEGGLLGAVAGLTATTSSGKGACIG